ncbi:MAG: four helix bundle protein [Proteobacteria bacterium]|nr:four helix bundle protein [Pseudomonadota bacterium]
MKSEELKKRTKKYAIEIIKLVQSLPKDMVAEVIGKQLLRSGTSVGANYRSACRARSKADFISKMKIVEEEADESLYWLELLEEAEIFKNESLAKIMKETTELLSIAVASVQTARKHL